MAPPLDSAGDQENLYAPPLQWYCVRSFDTSAECETYRQSSTWIVMLQYSNLYRPGPKYPSGHYHVLFYRKLCQPTGTLLFDVINR